MKTLFCLFCRCIAIFLITLIPSWLNAQDNKDPVQGFVSPFNTKANQTQGKSQFNAKVSPPNLKISVSNGSFHKIISSQSISRTQLENGLTSYFGLSDKHTFAKVREEVDGLGFTHLSHQQFYKGIPVDGNVSLSHLKNGTVEFINGHIAEIGLVETKPSISAAQAIVIAKDELRVSELLNTYPAELVIASKLGAATYRLAYKVRIDAAKPFAMSNVYVDAISGDVINEVSLIADADVAGSASTLYSGSQSIIQDGFAGGFRLRESGRKIETYDATNATFGAGGFSGFTDVTNPLATWTGYPRLSTFTITAVSTSWWQKFAGQKPTLYLVVKDASNSTVFTSGYLDKTNPPLTFTLNILLVNSPYTVQVWNHEAGVNDELGGSYIISNSVGTQSWSGNGNNGTYLIDTQNNPALDVHWGMEKTYDFYQSVFGRNSFDGLGSKIQNYLNPNGSIFLSTFGSTAGLPNNAFAMPAPYNSMVYGMGDGVQWRPVVALDVEGHEYTHMVVNNNGHGGLTYQGESGALNESFADIFGTCVEFYALGVNANWTIGEKIMITSTNLRSMSDPKNPTGYSQQPNTYGGINWSNPLLSDDNGGVHNNSGVQNYWFYLLSQGGSGTNDKGNAYSVTGIGINKASRIAYRNLTTYLTSNATYYDAYIGSVQAAQDLYGNPSSEYNAVRAAWYAVGVANDPSNFCAGTTTMTTSSGSLTDGSGLANYGNNASCKWVIKPAGATQVSLNFSAFDTEATFDFVYVYDGPDDTYPVLLTRSGNTLPSTINSTGGAMCVKFVSDAAVNVAGWSASYTSVGITPSCSGGNLLSAATGAFTDGSGAGNYGNNQVCYWLIAPPCASGVTLTLTQLSSELNYDGVVVYNGPSTSSPQLGVFSGATLPAPVTATSGQMLVVFVSDYSTTGQGFSANYTSTGSAICSGTTTLNSLDYGVLTDGSAANNYCNNLNCMWLIQPPQATHVSLNFTAFDVEGSSLDGNTNDAVEVYDGTTISAPLLGRFVGSNLPPAVTSTGGSILIRFFSNSQTTKQGWSAYYTSQTTSYCTATTTLSTPTGSISDGSGTNQYANNSRCSWLIKPNNATHITLSFSTFDTELNYDGVIVYDGQNNTAPVLGTFTGTTIPASVISTGGSMFIEFISDQALRASGWDATYTATVVVGLEENLVAGNLKFYPNPTHGEFIVKSDYAETLTLEIADVLGRSVLKTQPIGNGENRIDTFGLSKGVYLLKFQVGNNQYTKRLMVE